MRASWPRILVLALAAGCRSPSGGAEQADVRARLERIEAEVRTGAFARALEDLEELHELRGLAPEVRAREDRLIDEAARGRFAELAEGPADELEELFESELPERVRARAGVLAAQRQLAEGHRITAYRTIKEVEAALPGHPERVLAGEVLARAGLELIRDEGRYYLLFRYRPRGVQALEYLVIHYPLEPRCAEALYALSEAHEASGDYAEAIERGEDLLLYHPDSPYAPAASARLPYLRLARLQRDDYDRGELLRARAELTSWLTRYPDHELAGWVAELQQECAARLVRSDLYLAGFYRRTRIPEGQRLHAERARSLALEVGLAPEAEEAQALLDELAAALPPEDAPPSAGRS